MPPKARGRGGARGRGTGRGGAASGRSTTDMSAVEQASSEASASAGASDPTAAAQPESGADASETAADTNVSTSVEPHSASSVSASPMTSTQPEAGAANKIPRQRLDGLKSAEPASRSASPAVRRGASSRGKKAVALPTFSGRRSKEEREARTAADKQRELERNKERDKQAERKRIAKERDAKRLAERASRGRGGYSGAVSGPFSMQSARQDKRTTHRNFGGSSSGSRATRVKDEYGSYEGSSHRSGGASGGSSIKREEGDDASSEDDQDTEFPRKDIDLIELSSDEEENSSTSKLRTHLPVRIGRREHKERVVGINTDASTESSAKILQEADKGDAVLPANEENESSKGEEADKTDDVEITGEKKHARDTKQDLDTNPTIKPEPAKGDDEMEDVEQVNLPTGTTMTGTEMEKKEDADTVERKPRIREKKEPHLQTDEERAEWARYQSNLSHIRTELGPEDDAIVDASGDTNMIDAAITASKPSRRDDHVYLFQLPPIIPELKGPAVKKEASNTHPKAVEPSKPADKEGVHIKKEEEFSNPLASIPHGPNFASGRVGKLRVHQSGRTTLDWGGIDFELAPGKPASFLQEVVSIQLDPDRTQSAQDEHGRATSFGRVKGKFVVTPNFSSIFG